jgi:site-specific recombinase XerD
MTLFVQEKQACGYRYNEEIRQLALFDHFLFDAGLQGSELPRSIARQWLAKRFHESAGTHQHRITVVRQFAKFMIRLGYSAYIPEGGLVAREARSFVPRILTIAEIQKLLLAVDQLAPTAHAPLRHLIMPEVFRLLYGCGFRLSEVLDLQVRDVDLDQGILTVRQGKFCKDRLVPPAVSLVKRLREYATDYGKRQPDAFFFPSPSGGPWSKQATYHLFRKLLLESGIAHAGRGHGPRVHDLRHTFAVHTLVRWYREGADLDAKLPLLATYLGHQSLAGTQHYLHFTAELFPEITMRANTAFGDVIPRRVKR